MSDNTAKICIAIGIIVIFILYFKGTKGTTVL